MSKGDIVLGNKVQDIVTQFTGIAVNRLEYMDGRIEYGVQPDKTSDGKYPAVQYLPSPQLKRVDDGVHVEKVKPILGFHAGNSKENESGQ